ncbi:MAG TPA: hypothetical protein PKW90_08210 [Myxococcota bacterium]|nr:hypothetical protein [Myxococcota bacterium]
MLLLLSSLALAAPKPASMEACTRMDSAGIKMAMCGGVMVAYQDIPGDPSMGPVSFDAFNQGLVQGLTGNAVEGEAPVVNTESYPFVVKGKTVDGRHMNVSWNEETGARAMGGYSAGSYSKKNMRFGACFGLLEPGSEAPCLEILPYVMAKGLK